jgi:hypothetical protein
MHGVEMSSEKGPWMAISARCKRHSGESRALTVAVQDIIRRLLELSFRMLLSWLLVVCVSLQPGNGQHYTCPGETTNFPEASRVALIVIC